MKKFVSKVLLLIICLSMACSVSVLAVSLPNISSSKPLTTYTYNSSGKIYAYTNSSLNRKTGGYIACAMDECKIISIKGNAVQVRYPVARGTKTAWFKRSDFTYCNLANEGAKSTFTAKSSATVYRWKGKYTTLGSVTVNDYCYLLRGDKNSDWLQIIYPINGGYKMGWVTGLDYAAMLRDVQPVNNGNYVARTTAPSKNNEYYYSSKNIFYASGYGMPNCTAYAYGRTYENLGKKPNLCTRSAGAWYNYNKSFGYYSYGSTPKVGAIACWSKNGTSVGHVAVVEKINNNGSVLISESHYSGTNFNTRTIKANSSDYLRSYTFMGYIYVV